MPFRQFGDGVAVLPVHHLRKSDGGEATGSRGSGALPSFADVIVELRRFDALRPQDRRRLLTGYSRWDETPDELVIELAEDASGYTAQGDRAEVGRQELRALLREVLPAEPPGKTIDEIREKWPDSRAAPRKQKLIGELARGLESGDWHREGKGVKCDPYRYWARNPFD
jgi:hypothetical protein